MISLLEFSAYPAAKICLVALVLLLYWNLLDWFVRSDMNARDIFLAVGGTIIIAFLAAGVWLWISYREAIAGAITTPSINNNSGSCNGTNNCNGAKLAPLTEPPHTSDCPPGYPVFEDNQVFGIGPGATGYKIYKGYDGCFIGNKASNIRGGTGYDIGSQPPAKAPK